MAIKGQDQPSICGLLNVDKLSGVTSRDVVNQIQRQLPRKTKVGHGGTLDPMATGVLILAIGRATRLIPVVHEFSKTYLAGVTLGQTSDTDDVTGDVQSYSVDVVPDRATVLAALNRQVGRIEQRPPKYSAIKVKGQRAYQAARQGKSVSIEPRQVTVHSIEMLNYEFPCLELEIRCGSGTYIRSIARDLGRDLNTGGLLNSLERTRVGPFTIQNSTTVDQIGSEILSNLQPVETLFPDQRQHYRLNDHELLRLKDGKPLTISALSFDCLVAMTAEGRFAARLKRLPESDQYRADINWVPAWFLKPPN